MAELTRAYVKKQRSKWQVAKVDTPEFGKGDCAYVRRLPASVIVTHAKVFEGAEKEGDLATNLTRLAQLCSLGICSKDGEPLYTLKQSAELLTEWPNEVLQRCATKLIEFNKLGTDIKVKAKNLPASRRSSSRSGSRMKLKKRRT